MNHILEANKEPMVAVPMEVATTDACSVDKTGKLFQFDM